MFVINSFRFGRTPSSASEWSGATASFTFSGDDIIAAAVDKSIKTLHTFPGDIQLEYTLKNVGSGNFYVGFYPITDDASYNENSTTGDVLTGSNGNVFIRHTGDTTYTAVGDGSNEASNACSLDDVFLIERNGSTWTLKINDSLVHTWTFTSNSEMRLVVGDGSYTSGSDCMDIDDISWSGGV